MSTSVPDTDALRRAALQASWRRGRWVARRRVVWRWTAWASVRIGLPVALFVAAVAAATPWLARLADDTPSWMSTAPPDLAKAPAAVAAPKVQASATSRPPVPSSPEPAAQTPGTEPVDTTPRPRVPGLRLDLSLPTATPAQPAPPTTNVGDTRP